MKHLASRELHGYWNRLRGARAAPERSDIDPGAIRTILADTFLAEIVGEQSAAGRDFIIRLSGTRLSALWGQELQGCSLLSLWRKEDQTALRELLALVLDDRLPVVAGARSEGAIHSVELETLFLPLRHHGKTHTRLFGSIAAHRDDGWQGFSPIGTLCLTSFRTIASAPRGQLEDIPSAARCYGPFKVYEGGRGS